MRFRISVSVVLLFAWAAAASEIERILLPIAPSVVYCGYDSKYEMRLLAYNDSAKQIDRLCVNGECGSFEPGAAREFSGQFAGGLPLPVWIDLPRAEAEATRMSLLVESSERGRPAMRSYTEIPVVRESEFRDVRMQFVGVRMDPGFRQTIRIYGLDPYARAEVMMRVFSLETGEELHSCVHELWPLSFETGDGGLAKHPSFGMECDMSEHVLAHGQKVRIELEPVTPGQRYWAFISVTNNETQHFYTVLPR
ncbi:MAG: hypothetical protein ACSLFQ_07565 [Thermoanaerobaculia bacterium]